MSISAETITLGYFDNAPHAFKDGNGACDGALKEFLQKKIGPEMGVSVNLVSQPIARILQSMSDGTIDGAVLFGFTKERAEKYNFPTNNFFELVPVIIVPIDSKIKNIKTAEDLKDLKIGYALKAIESPFVRGKGLEFDKIGGTDALEVNFRKLTGKRIDAIYWPDKPVVVQLVKKLGLEGKVRIIQLPEKAIPLYTIFSKKSSHKDLSSRYDKAFEKINGKKLYMAMLTPFLSK